MRTENEYRVDGGFLAAIATPNNLSTPGPPIPDPGLLKEIFIIVTTGSIDVLTTFNIMVNAVDSGVVIPLPVGVQKDIVFVPALLNLQQGDAVRLRTNGESTTTAGIRIAYIVRR